MLKGGAALYLVEGIQNRLSTDLDFSTEESIKAPKNFFGELTGSLNRRFESLGYDVVDARYTKKPKTRTPKTPKYWSGWNYRFKLSDVTHRGKADAYRRRSALVPADTSSSNIEIEISEFEFCGEIVRAKIGGVDVTAYSNTLLILEKIRAICQQHHTYPLTASKNRARDYFDIVQLVQKHRRDEGFHEKLSKNLDAVFEAKGVPLDLLDRIFDEEFVEVQRRNFSEVHNTVKGKVQEFEYYNEQLKLLIRSLREY